MDDDLKNTDKNKYGDDNNDFPGYPMYPTTDDIYSQLKEETEIDPKDITKVKSKDEDPDIKLNENQLCVSRL